MANGLRKLIRKTRRNFINPSKLSRRLDRFGPRLKVEELEERIAPANAVVVLSAGDYLPYDTDGGIGMLYNASAGGEDVTVSITDGGGAGVADTITIDLDTAGASAAILHTNAEITSGGSTTALITDSADVALTFKTGVGTADMDLTGDGASTPAGGDYTTGSNNYFDGAADPGTGLAMADNAAATVAAAAIAAASDLGGDVTGTIALNNSVTVSDLTELHVNAAGTDSGDFAGSLTVLDDVVLLTIDGTASGAAWDIDGSTTGAIAIGTLDGTADIDIAGDLGNGAGDTFTVGTGAMAGDLVIGGSTNSNATISTTAGAITGAITITGTAAGNITAAAGITGDVTVTGTLSGDVTATTVGITGDIEADTISGTLLVTDGSLTGNVTTTGAVGTGNIGDINVDTNSTSGADLSGVITGVGTLGTVTVGDDISGDFVITSTITEITTVAGDFTADADISAGGTITTLEATAGNFIGDAITTNGDLTTLTVGDAFSGTLNIDDALTTATIDNNIGGTILAGNIGTLTSTDGSLTGTVESDVGAITTVNIDNGDSNDGAMTDTASITSATTIGAITVGEDIAGNITAGSTITTIQSDNGDITADSVIQAGGTITTIEADENETEDGAIAAAITTTSGNITTIDAGDNISGVITSAGSIDTVTTDGNLSSIITATVGGFTGNIQIDDGMTAAGELVAVAGNFAGTIDIDTGGMLGNIEARAGDIDDTVTVTAGDVSGTITAGTNIDGDIDIVAGDFSGTIEAGTSTATGVIAGNITVTAGDITAAAAIETTNGNISGNINVVAGDISGDIKTADGDITGDINASGTIDGLIGTVTGDLSGDVEAAAGDITNIAIGGAINSALGANDQIIEANGGSVTAVAETMVAAGGNDLYVRADGSVSLTIGTGIGAGTVTATDDIFINANLDGLAAVIDATNGDDVIMTSTGDWTGTIDVDGYDINIVNSGGAILIDDLTADNDIELIQTTGATENITIGGTVVTNDIVNITASGALSFTAGVTAGNDITLITGNSVAFTGAVAASNDITAITSTTTLGFTSTVTAANDITALTAGDAITFGNDVTATAGDVVAITGLGITITTKIEAPLGRVTLVDAGAGNLVNGGTIEAGLATTASALMTVVDTGVKYTIESSAAAGDGTFDLVFTPAATNTAAVIFDPTPGHGTTPSISLMTVTDGTDAVNETSFDLSSLIFAPATLNADKTLGSVLVEGSVTGNIILDEDATMSSLAVQDDLGGVVIVGSIDLLAFYSYNGGTNPSDFADAKTQADNYTSKLGGIDPASVLATGAFTIPLATGQDTYVLGATNTTFDSANMQALSFLSTTAAEAVITYAAGAITNVTTSDAGAAVTFGGISTPTDLSAYEGDVVIVGNIDAVLTIGDNDSITITGDVNAGISGTDADITGNFSVTGDVLADIDFDGGNIGGTLSVTGTVGANIANAGITGAVTLNGGASDSVSPLVTLDFADIVGALTVTGDMDGTITSAADVGTGVTFNDNVGGTLTIADEIEAGGLSVVGANVELGATITVVGEVNGGFSITTVAVDTGNLAGTVQLGSIADSGANVDGTTSGASLIVDGTIVGDLTLGDVTGTVSVNETDGNTNGVTGSVTIGDVTGTVNVDGEVDGATGITVGDVAGATAVVSFGNQTSSAAGAKVEVGDVSADASVTFGTVGGDLGATVGDVTGTGATTVTIGNVVNTAADADVVIGDVSGALLIALGSVDNDLTIDSLDSPLTVGAIGGAFTINDDVGANGSVVQTGDTGGAFFVDGDLDGPVTIGDADSVNVDNVNALFTMGAVANDVLINGDATVAPVFGGDIDGTLDINGDVTGNLDLDDVGALDVEGSVSGFVLLDDTTAGGAAGHFDIAGGVGGTITFDDLTGQFILGTAGVPAAVVADITGDDVALSFTVGDVLTDGVDILIGDVGTTISVGAVGDATNDATFTSDTVGGASTFDSVGDNSSVELASSSAAGAVTPVGGTVTITNDMDGLLVLHGANTIDVNIGGEMASAVLVYGNAGDVTSVGDMGDADSVVAASGSLDSVSSSTGSVNASVITGGDGADTMAVSAATDGEVVAGQLAIGVRMGARSLTVTSGTDIDQALLSAGGAAIFAAAGNFSGTLTTDFFDTIVLNASAGNVSVLSLAGGAVNAGEIISGDAYGGTVLADGSVTASGNPNGVSGVIAISDDADVSSTLDDAATFTAMAAGLLGVEAAAATVFADFLTDLGVSALESTFGDNGAGIDFTGDIEAGNVDGLLVSGDINDVSIDILGNMGYIVSLFGCVDAYVHAGLSIGSILASEDIDGDFISEGTIAVGDDITGTGGLVDVLDGLNLDDPMALETIPMWFTGGVLAEVGDLGSSGDRVQFSAQAASGDAMGMLYGQSGAVYAYVDVFGDFVGLNVLGSGSISLSLPDTASIDQLVAPNASVGGSYNADNVGVLALSGSTVLMGGDTATFGNMSIELVGAGLSAIVEADTTSFENIYLIGLASGTEAIVNGDVDVLTVIGNWAGLVEVNSVALNETLGEVDEAVVKGNVDGTYGEFEAFGFGTFMASGTNGQMTAGSMEGGDIETWTNINGDDQLLYLRGSSNVEADYTQVFGQLTEVDVAGSGNAGLLSMNFTGTAPTEGELNQVLQRVPRGDAFVYDMGDGSAHIGAVDVDGHSTKLKLKEVVADGNLESLNSSSNRAMKSLWVSGDADEVKVSKGINRAFIGGNVDLFATGIAKNTTIDGNVDTFAVARAKNVTVRGTTDSLLVPGNTRGEGKIIDSHFLGEVSLADVGNRIVRSTINGQLVVNGQIVQNYYGY